MSIRKATTCVFHSDKIYTWVITHFDTEVLPTEVAACKDIGHD